MTRKNTKDRTESGDAVGYLALASRTVAALVATPVAALLVSGEPAHADEHYNRLIPELVPCSWHVSASFPGDPVCIPNMMLDMLPRELESIENYCGMVLEIGSFREDDHDSPAFHVLRELCRYAYGYNR